MTSIVHEITCEPTGLVLCLRELKVGDIHYVLYKAAEKSQNAGAMSLVSMILDRLQVAPYVSNPGHYGAALVTEAPVDFKKILMTDITSAIFRARMLTGTPMNVEPTCENCAKPVSAPLEIDLTTTEHWSCSEEGIRCLTEDTTIDLENEDYVVQLGPPTQGRTLIMDKALSAKGVPQTLGALLSVLTSIQSIHRKRPIDAAASETPVDGEILKEVKAIQGLTEQQKRALDEEDTPPQGKPITVPSKIIQWWQELPLGPFSRQIEEKVEALWGGVDRYYDWTCEHCEREQVGLVPLDLSFFGLVTSATSRRRKKPPKS